MAGEGWVELSDDEVKMLIQLNGGKPLTEGMNSDANTLFVKIIMERGNPTDG